MKIGLIAPLEEAVSTARFGGTERIIGHIANGLVDRGHSVTLFASGDSETKAELVSMSDKPILHASQREKDSIYSLYFLKLLRNDFDVELWSNHLLSYPLAFAPALAKPMVTTVHSECIPSRLALLQEASRDSQFVAISDNQRSTYPDVNFIDRIYNGTDTDSLPLGRGDGNYLAWLGRFTAKKGAREAVQVAQRTNSALKLAGELPEDPSSPDRQYFDAYVKPFLSEKIEYVGRADIDAKRELLQGATALLSPLSWPEPFGLVATEAMSCGTPVITTRMGAMPELIVDGVTGYLVDQGEEMDARVADTAGLDRTAIRQHVVERFGIATMLDSYERLYEETIQKAAH